MGIFIIEGESLCQAKNLILLIWAMTRIGKEITQLSNALIVGKSLLSAEPESIMGKGPVQNVGNPPVIVIFTERNPGARPV